MANTKPKGYYAYTHQEIADTLGITKNKVQAIEKTALRKIARMIGWRYPDLKSALKEVYK